MARLLFLSALAFLPSALLATTSPSLLARDPLPAVVPTPPFFDPRRFEVKGRAVEVYVEQTEVLVYGGVEGGAGRLEKRQVTVTVPASSSTPPGTDTVFATATVTVTPSPSTVTVTQGNGGAGTGGTTTVTQGTTQTQGGQGTVTVTAEAGGGIATTVVTQGGTGVAVTTVTVVNSSPRSFGWQASALDALPYLLACFGAAFGALFVTA